MKEVKKQLDSIKLLFEAGVKGNAEILEEKSNVITVKCSCGNLVLDNDEVVQVQILVTRDSDEKLDDLEVAEYESY